MLETAKNGTACWTLASVLVSTSIGFTSFLSVCACLKSRATDLIDSPRHLDVALRHSTGIVRDQRHGHFVIADINVRMMIGLLRCVSYFVDKLHGCFEVRKFENPLDGFALSLPFRKGSKRLLSFRVG